MEFNKKKSQNVSLVQRKFLLDYLKEQKGFIGFEHLVQKLHTLEGPKKNLEQWKRFAINWKHEIKKKGSVLEKMNELEYYKRMSKNVSSVQKQFLLDYMNKHEGIIEWGELVQKLHLLEGPKKTLYQWKKVFNKLKYNIKKKACVHKEMRELEEKAMNTFGITCPHIPNTPASSVAASPSPTNLLHSGNMGMLPPFSYISKHRNSQDYSASNNIQYLPRNSTF